MGRWFGHEARVRSCFFEFVFCFLRFEVDFDLVFFKRVLGFETLFS